MKVIVLGDTHFRPKDFDKREKLYSEIIESNPDCSYVFHTGDLFDTVRVGNDSLRTEDMVSRIAAIHNKFLMPLIVIKGNHDEGHKGSALDFFSHPLIKVINTAKVLNISGKNCLFIPWAGGNKEAIKELLSRHKDNIDYIFGHADVVGASNNAFITEDENKSLWCFSPKDFQKIPTFLGHIHTAQVIGETTQYIGTIEQLSFMEEGNYTGYIILNLETGECETKETVGQKYFSSFSIGDLPTKKKEQYHIRLKENYDYPPEIEKEFLSFKKALKLRETVKRKDVIEIENKDEFTAKELFSKYIEFNKKTDINIEDFSSELEEINQIFLNRNSNKAKGIKKFNSITTKNIGMLVDKTYPLTSGINMVYGKVGSGKTTLVESLFSSLYGYYPYNILRKNINSFLRSGSGDIYVSVTDTENAPYMVHRALNKTTSGKASITLPGQKEKLENKTVIDAQSELIFGNRDSMSKTCFIDQNNEFDILDKQESQRMNGLRDILGLEVFYEIEEFISNRTRETGSKKVIENNITVLLNTISTHTDELSLAKESRERLFIIKNDLEDRLKELEKKVNNKFHQTHIHKIKTVYSRVGKVNHFNDFILPKFDIQYAEEIRKQLVQDGAELRELKKQATYSCESCGFVKDLSQAILNKEIEITDKNNDIKEIDKCYYPIQVSDLEFVEENLTLNEYNYWEEEQTELIREVSKLKYSIQETQFKLGRSFNIIDTYPAKLKTWDNQLIDLRDKLKKSEKWSFLSEAFGRKGVSNYILSSAVNELQLIFNELLSEVNCGFSLLLNTQVEKKTAFVETLEVLMIKEGFEPYDCRAASGGEKNFIRILWKVAMSIYLHSRSPMYKILIMDEPTSNSDPWIISLLQQVITSMKHYFEQIIVVTHNDFLSSHADNVIRL